ncbi:hypothetical protein V8Z69_07520 [Microbacterium aurugineum]|uniref:hypothetical protein n=1 Tax=Microbacterium aurugineum TaxID=2851642 RepID=UPI0039BE9DB9
MQWYSASDQASLDRIEDAWSDAPVDNPELCEMLLDVARGDVVFYAEAEDPNEQITELLTLLGYSDEAIAAALAALGEDVPETPPRYVFAQLQQAKNLYNAGRIVGNQVGGDGFSFVPRPLSKEIQKIIRPQSGVAHVL